MSVEDFVEAVLSVVEAIPPGRVMAYGDIAEMLGAGGPRQVGRVLSTLSLAPLPASNGVIDLGLALDYAVAHSGIPGLYLALGTTPFDRAAMAPALP